MTGLLSELHERHDQILFQSDISLRETMINDFLLGVEAYLTKEKEQITNAYSNGSVNSDDKGEIYYYQTHILNR